MAAAVQKQKKSEVNTVIIKLSEIQSNRAQSRGMGVLSTLYAIGYGLFEKKDAELDPIWPDLTGDDAAKRTVAAARISENEPEIVKLAESIRVHGQLQPIGVMRDKDGSYDVVYGMRRSLAHAWLHATEPDKFPGTIRAEIKPWSDDELMIKFIAHTENQSREDESPIDRAMFYASLKKEFKLKPSEIAERIDMSEQHVKDYLSLLHPKLEDKRMLIHEGKYSVDRAVKLLKVKLQGDDADNGRDQSDKKRARFPSVKTIELAYNSGIKPKKMSDELWEFYKLNSVREFIAKSLGFKFKEYKAPKAKKISTEEPGVASENGDGKKIGYKITVPRKSADKLLICLGQTNAATWDDATVIAKLENIVSLGEEGMQLEDKGAQSLFDKLIANYVKGLKVSIK